MAYEKKVNARPYNVPLGIALLGCFRSPDILAPLGIISMHFSGH
jgi:hypothetical protein